MSVHSKSSELLMTTKKAQTWMWGTVLAVQDCPRATTPAGPGLIPALAQLAELQLCQHRVWTQLINTQAVTGGLCQAVSSVTPQGVTKG